MLCSDIDVGKQPLVFSFEPLELARVLDRNRGNARNRSHKLQMISIELIASQTAVEVQTPILRSKSISGTHSTECVRAEIRLSVASVVSSAASLANSATPSRNTAARSSG
jgi:hypothetical protein